MSGRSRIDLMDTPMSACMKMADGNPGAIRVMAEMVGKGGEIDPDDWAGGLGSVLSMDTHRIYGPRIWMLYKDVCQENLRITIALLRSVQLGFLREENLHHAIDNCGDGIDVAEMIAKVEERLPNFKRA